MFIIRREKQIGSKRKEISPEELTKYETLFEKYFFREGELKKDLESYKIINDQIREVFFNHMMRIGGEFYKIKSASDLSNKK